MTVFATTSASGSTAFETVDMVLLCGGVGGAKLASGLSAISEPGHLAIVVNTGDDFWHAGLRICPDIDTVTYTLAGVADPVRGWGIADETWGFMKGLEALGGPTWFNLGDRDLAMHIRRTELISHGRSLTEITAELAGHLGVIHPIVPMSDDPIATFVETNDGPLPFQEYFVRHRCKPEVRSIRFDGAAAATATSGLTALFERDTPPLAVIAPSNPYLSVDPILAVPGIREWLRRPEVTVIAVSPIVSGEAIKGPTAKIMRELGLTPSVTSIARHYADIVDCLVIDDADTALAYEIESLGIVPLTTPTVMRTQSDRERLGAFIRDLHARR